MTNLLIANKYTVVLFAVVILSYFDIYMANNEYSIYKVNYSLNRIFFLFIKSAKNTNCKNKFLVNTAGSTFTFWAIPLLY